MAVRRDHPRVLHEVEDVVDRGTLVQVAENEPLTERKVAAVGAGAGLPPTIPPGMRAISLRVNDVVGVAGFVTPGNRVDVFVTLKRNDTTPSRASCSATSRCSRPVLRSTRTRRRPARRCLRRSSPCCCHPEDAERVVLASTEGQMMLALSNPLDVQQTTTPGTRTVCAVRRRAEAASAKRARAARAAARPSSRRRRSAPPPPVPKPYTVEAIRGAKRNRRDDPMNCETHMTIHSATSVGAALLAGSRRCADGSPVLRAQNGRRRTAAALPRVPLTAGRSTVLAGGLRYHPHRRHQPGRRRRGGRRAARNSDRRQGAGNDQPDHLGRRPPRPVRPRRRRSR